MPFQELPFIDPFIVDLFMLAMTIIFVIALIFWSAKCLTWVVFKIFGLKHNNYNNYNQYDTFQD